MKQYSYQQISVMGQKKVLNVEKILKVCMYLLDFLLIF